MTTRGVSRYDPRDMSAPRRQPRPHRELAVHITDLAKQVEDAAQAGDWPAAIKAAQRIADYESRDLLWSVINAARAAEPSMSETEIAKLLGVQRPSVYERFPPPEPRWRRKSDTDT